MCLKCSSHPALSKVEVSENPFPLAKDLGGGLLISYATHFKNPLIFEAG
jgi:hypothetical protein